VAAADKQIDALVFEPRGLAERETDTINLYSRAKVGNPGIKRS
jgi:hypothetical protein